MSKHQFSAWWADDPTKSNLPQTRSRAELNKVTLDDVVESWFSLLVVGGCIIVLNSVLGLLFLLFVGMPAIAVLALIAIQVLDDYDRGK